MKHSESVAKIAAAFVQAQKSVGIAIKNAVNPHLKNKYADLGAVWDACSAALQANGLSVMQLPVSSCGDGRLHMETVLVHESGEWMSGEVDMPISKNDPQAYGAALTYARRYGLAAMMGVTQDDDDGARAVASDVEARAYELVELIKAAGSLDDLKTVFVAAHKEVGSDKTGAKIITIAKDARKKELSNGSAD